MAIGLYLGTPLRAAFPVGPWQLGNNPVDRRSELGTNSLNGDYRYRVLPEPVAASSRIEEAGAYLSGSPAFVAVTVIFTTGTARDQRVLFANRKVVANAKTDPS